MTPPLLADYMTGKNYQRNYKGTRLEKYGVENESPSNNMGVQLPSIRLPPQSGTQSQIVSDRMD